MISDWTKGQRTEDGGQKTEDRGQRAEDRRRKAEDGGQRTKGWVDDSRKAIDMGE